jgi:hypothetical protein
MNPTLCILILILTAYCFYEYNRLNSEHSTKQIGRNVLHHLNEITYFIGENNQTFNEQMTQVVVHYDQEFQSVRSMMESIEFFLFSNNQFTEDVRTCLSLMKELELDYFNLQRKSITTLYQERDILNTILYTFPNVWDLIIARWGTNERLERAIQLLDGKMVKFRNQINELVQNQYVFINKAQKFETLIMEKSIQTNNQSMWMERLSLFLYGTGGVGVGVVQINSQSKCGTNPWCLFKTIVSFTILESQAITTYQDMESKSMDSMNASKIMFDLSKTLSDMIEYLRMKVRMYDQIIFNFHNLESKSSGNLGNENWKIGDSIESIKNSIDRCIVEINIFLDE